MGTAMKHPVPDRVKPSFVIFLHPGTLTPTPRASECPDVKNYKQRLNPVRTLYPYVNSGHQRVKRNC